MGDFRKKNILQTDFDGEKYLARKYLTQKMSCTEKKNVSHVAPLYVVICLGKTQNQIVHTRPSSPATLLKRQ